MRRAALLLALSACGTPLLPPTTSSPVTVADAGSDPVDAGPTQQLTDLQVRDGQTLVASDTGSVDLGGQQVLGEQPTTRTLTLTNGGAAPLAILASGVTLTGIAAADFSLVASDATLAPGASTTLQITFAPTSVGLRTATLLVQTAMGTFDAELRGTGTAQHVYVGVGGEGRRAYSVDGQTWLEADHDDRNRVAPADCPDAAHQFTGPHGLLMCKPTVVTDVGGFHAVCYGNGRYVATAAPSCANIVDPDGTEHGTCGVPGFTYLSIDGKKWKRVSDTGGSSCAYGNGSFVIAVDNAPLVSTDGLSWTVGGEFDAAGPKNQYGGLAAGFKHVIFDGKRFVATGSSDAVATSHDGRTWSSTVQLPGTNSANLQLQGSGGRAILSEPKVVHIGETWVDGRTCKASADCAASDTTCIAAAYVLSVDPMVTDNRGCSCAWNDNPLACFQLSMSTEDNTWSTPESWSALITGTLPHYTFSGSASGDGHVFLFGPDQNAVLDDGATAFRFIPRTFSYANPGGIVVGPVGADGKRTFIATGWQAEIYWSTDDGQSWQRYDMTAHHELDNSSWAGFTYGRDEAP